ncbi:Chorion transcription factor Cf2 [Frankliniella fusca]|uniref:Chorion transcription factor Cf2 n=1 Tax=Frankliniella fusca TaxID=407009 RepID=A0AAE1HN87_9NEOP|nr:Chorion transcription factor Cf2 [Frankliniella fusca]
MCYGFTFISLLSLNDIVAIMSEQTQECDFLSLKCGNCGDSEVTYSTFKSLNEHYTNVHPGISQFFCGYCESVLLNKTSLIRHVKTHQEIGTRLSPRINQPPSLQEHQLERQGGNIINETFNHEDMDVHEETDDEMNSLVDSPRNDLRRTAAEVLLQLRSKASLTGAAIQRFQEGCNKLLQSQRDIILDQVAFHLREKGLPEDDLAAVLEEIKIPHDVFVDMDTIPKQLDLFAREFGLVKPEEKYLGTRIDKRLDPKLNTYLQTQVNETFMSVSITASLKSILSSKKIRNNIFKELASTDGVLRSYVDGYHFKDHPFLKRHRNVLHILLFYDELEVSNPLGSKTSIHKLGAFFFQVMNSPAHVSSQLSSIHLLALVYAEDMKTPGAFEKVLAPFVVEMKKLSSDEGVEIELDGKPFVLRAVLVAVAADALAAHDLLGLLSPSARYFCRQCMISRQELRQDGNCIGQPRTQETHDQQVEEVQENFSRSTLYGVKRSCPLYKVPFFKTVEGSVFDGFHDVLEGIAPLVVKLFLRNVIYVRKLLSLSEFNIRLSTFTFGIPDSKNKPSSNFVREMLSSRKKLKQTGSQMWCLMRALPFLVGDCLPEGDQHMELIFLLQDIMKIIFSFHIKPEDLDHLETLIFRHHELFKILYIDQVVELEREEVQLNENLEQPGEEPELDENIEENEDEDEEQDEHEEPQRRRSKQKLTVHITNKFHHLKHYPDMIRKYGPAVRVWCAKFEGRLKIFRRHAAICCNFKNIPKTMAQMFQLSNVIQDGEEDSVQHSNGISVLICDVEGAEDVTGLTGADKILATNSASLFGEEYRPGLFVSLSDTHAPQFALISKVFVHEKIVYLQVKPWKTLCLSAKYNCFRVAPDDDATVQFINARNLSNFRAIAPWSPYDGRCDIYLSMRTSNLPWKSKPDSSPENNTCTRHGIWPVRGVDLRNGMLQLEEGAYEWRAGYHVAPSDSQRH